MKPVTAALSGLTFAFAIATSSSCEQRSSNEPRQHFAHTAMEAEHAGDMVYQTRDGTRLSATLESSLGKRFSVEAELPPKSEGAGRAAALMVPSQVHGLRDKQTLKLSEWLRSRGMVVMRFDWASATGQRPGPSSTEPRALAHEVAELQSALSLLSTHPRVDPKRVLIIGRGVGAVAAYRAFTRSTDPRALVLLEPPCIDDDGFALRYPDLANFARPVLLLGLSSAPACPSEVLARALSGMPGRVEHVQVATQEEFPASIASFWQRLGSQQAGEVD